MTWQEYTLWMADSLRWPFTVVAGMGILGVTVIRVTRVIVVHRERIRRS